MTKLQKAGAKVVSFERGADYYFLKYQRQLDRGAYLDALDSLRAAVRKAPGNREYKLALAEFCTEINYFEESNYWVLDVMSREEDADGQCLFLLGCNFLVYRRRKRLGSAWKSIWSNMRTANMRWTPGIFSR